jgi:nucleotide-binding universal stress UspA family protein
MFTHILLPTDGSRTSKSAERAAIELARRFRARITAVHVVAPASSVALEAWAHSNNRFGEHLEESFETRAVMRLEDLREIALCAGVACDCEIARGEPQEQILNAARRLGCDLIMMATHRKDANERGLLESVSAKVAAASPVPVLVWQDR